MNDISEKSSIPDLFTSIQVGPHQLSNRIIMAPMTRNRAGQGNVPGSMNVTYYTQRASAGLIITDYGGTEAGYIDYPYLEDSW